jgi:hypothetical protein
LTIAPHKSQKVQFEIVCVLGLLAMFTHVNAFWVAALLLALVDIPDFGTPLNRIARALEKMAVDRFRQFAARGANREEGKSGEPFLLKHPALAGRATEESARLRPAPMQRERLTDPTAPSASHKGPAVR